MIIFTTIAVTFLITITFIFLIIWMIDVNSTLKEKVDWKDLDHIRRDLDVRTEQTNDSINREFSNLREMIKSKK